jgi:NADH dehydrogenase
VPTVRRPPRVCILGGTGFVGSAIVEALHARGYDMRVPTRSRASGRHLQVFPTVELLVANVHDEAALGALVRGCAAVINLVGILNERGHDGSGFRRAHSELAAKLVRACAAGGVPRLLQMSALKADADRGPSHYLRTKGEAERTIAASGVPHAIFRPSVIFGPGDSFTNRFAKLVRLLPVLPLACPDSRFAPAYVDDVASAFVTAVEDERALGRAYELCGPEIYTLEEVVRFAARHTGRRCRIVRLPPALGKLQAWVGDYLLPGKPISLDNFRSLGVASICGEAGFAALGIEPRAMSTIAPLYLEGRGRDRRLAELRNHARR